ncbi:hypothetical protein CHUAL_011710 [Chamberlinius hualienensis]
MDIFGFFLIPNWIIISFLGFFTIYLYFTWNFGYWEAQKIKCIRPIPVFGSLWNQFFEAVHSTDKVASSKLGKIWGIYEMRTPCLMVADAQLIKKITVNDFQHFSNRRMLPLTSKNRLARMLLPVMEGNEWQLTRSKLSIPFTSKRLNQMSSLFEESINSVFIAVAEKTESNSNFDVQLIFQALTADVIARSCFGRVTNDDFLSQTNLLSKSVTSFKMRLGSLLPNLMETLEIEMLPETCFNYFRKALLQAIGMRKQEKVRRNDFLQLILSVSVGKRESKMSLYDNDEEDDTEDENSALSESQNPKEIKVLNEDVLIANTILFIMAGYDNIANTLSFVTYLLALNQKCQEKLLEEIDNALQQHEKLHYDFVSSLPYLDAVVLETLRMYPPILRFERRCSCDYQLNNILIKKNMLVIIPIYAVHQNEDYFPSPTTFDPES